MDNTDTIGGAMVSQVAGGVAFAPSHTHAVAFDSDGSVFDTMDLKHRECFIPNTIKYYRLQPIARYAREVAEFVNLHSCWRGINRFPGLVKTFEMLRDRGVARRPDVHLPDWTRIQAFIDWAPALGNPSLRDAVERTGDPSLLNLLAWSEAVNRDIDVMVSGLPPIPVARQCIERLHDGADILVVSSGPTEALRKSWRHNSMDTFASVIAGQELGKPKDLLKRLTTNNYESGNVLMVGDAIEDLHAARSAGLLFYPIIPGREEWSWGVFHEVIMDQFLAGDYSATQEAVFVRDLEAVLPQTAPWQ